MTAPTSPTGRRHHFGESTLGPVTRLVVGTEPGPVLELVDLGASVHRLWVTGGDGVRRDVALGHPHPQAMLAGSDYLGATIGRYANRIAGGRFEVDGRAQQVGIVDRGHSLHGGPDGFDRRLWQLTEHTEEVVELRLHSPDGDQGFPGEVRATARFAVDAETVHLELTATTDAPTPVNLTSHLYLNLEGEGSGTIDHHRLRVAADAFHTTDDTGIPLPGGPADVSGTPFDLRRPRALGSVVRGSHPQLALCRGIDHDYVLDGPVGQLRPVAWLEAPRVGTRVELATDQLGLQVYTGNGLDGTAPSSAGGWHRQGDGLALEPQLFPDTPNRPDFGDAVLRPGQTYRSRTSWRFAHR